MVGVTPLFPSWLEKACELLAPFIVEFIGTFFLVTAIGFNVLGQTSLTPFGIGLTLTVLIFATGHISGAHFNPAVTLAVWVGRRKKINWLDALGYVVVQLLGGFVAGLFYWSVTSNTFEIAPGYGVSDGSAFGVELVWTFLLATVVLQVATTQSQAGNSFFGLSIGFTVVAGAITMGPVSGGVFNPAVGTGALLVHAIHMKKSAVLTRLWLYWLAPLLGGLLAGLLFWITNRAEFRRVYAPQKEHEHHGGEALGENLYGTDLPSVAEVSAHKRHGGQLVKAMAHRGQRLLTDDGEPVTAHVDINSYSTA